MPWPDDPPRRGEIYWVDWDPARGSEQAGHRPALIISPDHRNRHMPTVVVAALTRTVRDEVRQGRSPISVFLPAGRPMRDEGAVLAFQMLTIDKARLEDHAGTLSWQQVKVVNEAIKVVFGL